MKGIHGCRVGYYEYMDEDLSLCIYNKCIYYNPFHSIVFSIGRGLSNSVLSSYKYSQMYCHIHVLQEYRVMIFL